MDQLDYSQYMNAIAGRSAFNMLIRVPFPLREDHREETFTSWLSMYNSFINLFPGTNYVGGKIFQ